MATASSSQTNISLRMGENHIPIITILKLEYLLMLQINTDVSRTLIN